MTLANLKSQVAGMLETTVAALTVNGIDLVLQSINNAKNWAQSNYDFELARTSVDVSVSVTAGATLEDALEINTDRALQIKRIECAYVDYANANRPIRFVGKKTQVEDLRRRYQGLEYAPAYETPLASGEVGSMLGVPQLVQHGPKIFLYPDSSNLFTGGTANVTMDVVEWMPDYADLGSVTVAAGPACAGTFVTHGGTVNNKNMWLRLAGHALWYNSTAGAWWITSIANLGDTAAADRWALTSTSVDPSGTYTAAGAFAGSPVVTLATSVPSDFFLDYGAEFLLWKAVVECNHNIKYFVPRTEGNLPPPEKMADRAWASLLAWDSGLVAMNTTAIDLE